MTTIVDCPDFGLKVREFWDWVVSTFPTNIDKDDLARSLDRWMDYLDVPGWEISPIDEDNLYLAISPAGDPEKYEKTKYIVSLAPKIDGWSFVPARPKRIWDWHRTVLWGIIGLVDANGWKVVPYRYPDGMMELVFFDALLPPLKLAQKCAIAEFFICAEIGEDLLIRKICLIDFEENPTPEMRSDAILVSDLDKLRWE